MMILQEERKRTQGLQMMWEGAEEGDADRFWRLLWSSRQWFWMTLTNIFPGQYSLGLLMSTTAIPKGSAGIFSVQMNPSTTTLSKSCLWCQTLVLIALNSGVRAQNLFIPTVQPGGLERWSQGCPVWELCEGPSSFLQRPGQNRYNKLCKNFSKQDSWQVCSTGPHHVHNGGRLPVSECCHELQKHGQGGIYYHHKVPC